MERPRQDNEPENIIKDNYFYVFHLIDAKPAQNYLQLQFLINSIGPATEP